MKYWEIALCSDGVCGIIAQMAKSDKKAIGTQVLVERDANGVFIVSLPGLQGAHADGVTLEQAMKNLKEVIILLQEHYGERKFTRLIKRENSIFGVIPYEVEYV